MKLKGLLLLLATIAFLSGESLAQQQFTNADTLRGSITPQRAWWDVTFYDLHTTIHPSDSSISGYNEITYRVTEPQRGRQMQIDLIKPLQIDSAVQRGDQLTLQRQTDTTYFLEIPSVQRPGELHTISVWYHGKPKVAENPPWDGGFIWKTDQQGNPWIATANQGIGASVWWPNKDQLSMSPTAWASILRYPHLLRISPTAGSEILQFTITAQPPGTGSSATRSTIIILP
ncbi:MAG: hypothetical protein U5K69_29265 [Balneolaceae bacterium]|nr:hypothetical protein [Balneolaceae bacterium]